MSANTPDVRYSSKGYKRMSKKSKKLKNRKKVLADSSINIQKGSILLFIQHMGSF